MTTLKRVPEALRVKTKDIENIIFHTDDDVFRVGDATREQLIGMIGYLLDVSSCTLIQKHDVQVFDEVEPAA